MKVAHPHPSAIRLVFLAPLIFIYPGLLLQFAAAQSEIITITLKSDAATLATSLGSGMPSAKLLDQLDTADIDGLNFERVSVGTFGTVTPIPISAPPDTRIVNIPPGDGQNGFFKVTFELPSNFGEIELTGAANVDDLGRVFVNGDPISPSILSNDPGRITQFGNAVFSISDPLLFRPGENELLISDANTGSGPSGAAFYANITYRKLEPGNISPEVEITAPENGEGFAPGEEITISVEARDRDGAIDHVTFQVGLTQLGIDPDPPYTFSWAGAGEGTHVLTATAVDNEGTAATSLPVAVRVQAAEPGAGPFLQAVAIPDSGGWQYSDWFGFFNGKNFPWIYHSDHGWMFVERNSPESAWFWTEDLGWIWTGRSVYPFLNRQLDGDWLFYARETSNPRWFYHVTNDFWENDSRIIAAPGEIIRLSGSRFDPLGSTNVVFIDRSGNEISVPANEVTATEVEVTVPVFLDFEEVEFSSGATSLSIRQETQSGSTVISPVKRVAIDSLPETATAPGAVTLEILARLETLADNAASNWRTIADRSLGNLDTSEIARDLELVADKVAEARSLIQALADGEQESLKVGQSGDVEVVLDSAGLALLDRLLATYLFTGRSTSTAGAAPFATAFYEPSGPIDDFIRDADIVFRELTCGEHAVTPEEVFRAAKRVNAGMNAVTGVASLGFFAFGGPLGSIPAVFLAKVGGSTITAVTFIVPVVIVSAIEATCAFINGDVDPQFVLAVLQGIQDALLGQATSDAICKILEPGGPLGEVGCVLLNTLKNLADAVTELAPGVTLHLATIRENISLPTPQILLSSNSMTFAANQSSVPPTSQPVRITNSGSVFSTLRYAISSNASWLGLEITGNGELEAGAAAALGISVNHAGLPLGTFTDRITIADENADNSPQFINVALTVNPSIASPVISTSPTELEFEAGEETFPILSDTLTLRNTGTIGSVLNYAISADAPWIRIDGLIAPLPSGDAATFEVFAGIEGLEPNRYEGAITVAASGHSLSPVIVPVTLTITGEVPSLSIQSASISEGDAGSVEMVFDLTLSQAPQQEVTVRYATSGGTATAGADYETTTGSVIIPAGAVDAPLRITVFGDTVQEPDETFFVDLSEPVNAALGESRGVGTILDDDGVTQGLVIRYTASAEGLQPVEGALTFLPLGNPSTIAGNYHLASDSGGLVWCPLNNIN